MGIEKIDKNLKVDTNIAKEDIKFYNIRQTPFEINGIFYEDGKFRRMPEAVAKSVSDGVYYLHTNTAGGRVRFKTDSPYIAISAKMDGLGKMPHFALTGSVGFDIYVKRDGKDVYYKSFAPPFDIVDGYESVVEFENSNMREVVLNFPLYSNVCELYIGLSDKAKIEEPTPYKNKKPIVYYGSSITQGGCAARAGNSYQSIISRRFDVDYINLGFSGSARAEDEIIEYIKNLDMSLFVYDYDHNAPTVEHLEETHEKMFNSIREKNPDLPIIMMSKPRFYLDKVDEKRFEVIKKTYDNAKATGDENVYFIAGGELMKYAGNEGTVDDVHPTDFGFASMAKVLGDVMETIDFIK